MIIGWDLSTKLNGWAAGDGLSLPAAGAFELVEREDLGRMGRDFSRQVRAVQARFSATHWVVEQPLLTPHDVRWTLQRIYGVTFLLFTLAEALGIACRAVDHSVVKSEWAGAGADKDQMVQMCVELGIALPEKKAQGREDAADACGVWKVGVRLFAPQNLTRLDQALSRRRGGLI